MQKFLQVLLVFGCSLQCIFAGYLEFDATNGDPYKWSLSTDVKIGLDSGPVNGSISHAQGDTALRAAYKHYNDLMTGLDISIVGTTAMDITASNYDQFINFSAMTQQASASDCLISSQVSGANLVVFFDETGEVFAEIEGPNNAVLGLASPTLYDANGNITCAYLMINGARVTDATQLQYIMSHELGHALNLVHSQINGDLRNSDPGKVPLMYPFIPSNPGAALSPALKLDDTFSFSYLYAPDDISNNGAIEGTVQNRFGEGVLATNVICRDPLAIENSVSWVSGADLDGDGRYICGLLPSSNYEVEVSSIETAINVWDENPPFIATERYSGSSESFDPSIDDLGSSAEVNVSGSTVSDIDIVLNEDGRLSNNVSVSAIVPAGTQGTNSVIPAIIDYEYFVYIPSNATEATFRLEADDPSNDIDLLARCGSPFSLATGNAGPLYDQINPAQDQTDIEAVNSSGSESIELSGSSSPSLQECEYHLLVVNFVTEDVGFDLTASFTGTQPKVVFDFSTKNAVQDNGETLVASLVTIAKGDRFVIDGITFTDEGEVGLSNATAAKLYRDVNDNGSVDSDDTLIAETTSLSATSFTLTGVDLYLLDDQAQKFLITYDRPSSPAGYSLWTWLLLLGGVIGGFVLFPASTKQALCVTLLVIAMGSCSSRQTPDFELTIANKADIAGSALGFGSDFAVDSDAVKSVQDYFSN